MEKNSLAAAVQPVAAGLILIVLTSAQHRITILDPWRLSPAKFLKNRMRRSREESVRKLMKKFALVRAALERSLAHPAIARTESAFNRVKDLCGVVKGGPRDMSTNRKHFKNFGK